MTEKYFLIFDYGASNGRSIVASYNGYTFDMEINHRFENKPVFVRDTLYWNILELYRELKNGLQQSFSNYKKIYSMGITAWGVDFGILDKNGKLISNPVHYRDQQRVKDSEKLFEIITKKELFELTGYWINPIFDLFQLYSSKINNSPDIMIGEKLLSIPSLFNYFLTGEKVSEKTRAATSALYDQVNDKWQNIILNKLGIPEKIFSPIVKPGTNIGNLCESVSRELSIKSIPVVAPASHDTASAVVFHRVPHFKESDWVCLAKLYTALPIFICQINREKPVND